MFPGQVLTWLVPICSRLKQRALVQVRPSEKFCEGFPAFERIELLPGMHPRILEEVHRRGGTQDDDFKKGIIGSTFTKFLRRNRGGGWQGHSDSLIVLRSMNSFAGQTRRINL